MRVPSKDSRGGNPSTIPQGEYHSQSGIARITFRRNHIQVKAAPVTQLEVPPDADRPSSVTQCDKYFPRQRLAAKCGVSAKAAKVEEETRVSSPPRANGRQGPEAARCPPYPEPNRSRNEGACTRTHIDPHSQQHAVKTR